MKCEMLILGVALGVVLAKTISKPVIICPPPPCERKEPCKKPDKKPCKECYYNYVIK